MSQATRHLHYFMPSATRKNSRLQEKLTDLKCLNIDSCACNSRAASRRSRLLWLWYGGQLLVCTMNTLIRVASGLHAADILERHQHSCSHAHGILYAKAVCKLSQHEDALLDPHPVLYNLCELCNNIATSLLLTVDTERIRRGSLVVRQVSHAESFLPRPSRCSTGVMQVSSITKHHGSSLAFVRMQLPLLTMKVLPSWV